jgi:hypothetical protein
MKVFITLTEYENDPDGTVVTVNTNLPDGSNHNEVTAVFNRALSALYGYNIGGDYFDDSSSNS